MKAVWIGTAVVSVFLPSAYAEASPRTEVLTLMQIDQPLHPGCEFSVDAMRLNVTDAGKVLATLDFCSSYGKADAKIIEDRRGRNYVTLETLVGHGTNATTTYLTVYRLSSDLIELMRIPVSWAVAPTQQFTYSYQITADESGGFDIELIGADVEESNCCVPPEKIWTIRIDPTEPR